MERRTLNNNLGSQSSIALQDKVNISLQKIMNDDKGINACISLTEKTALNDLDRVLEARDREEPLPLDGMTFVVKDNIEVSGERTTMGSKWFAKNIPSKDATVIQNLRKAGGIILAKANMHEFAFGGTNINPTFGATKNPWDKNRITGGSSGGSAAAVAANWSDAAIGTDTGGSVRIPAALCGVAGLRPTYGVISKYGVFPTGPSFDSVGPMARHVSDVNKIFNAILGFDPNDVDAVETLNPPKEIQPVIDLRGIRIGVPRNYFFDDVDSEIINAIKEAINIFADLGASIIEMNIPEASRAAEVVNQIVRVEAFSVHHDRLKESPENFGEDVGERLKLGEELKGWEMVSLYRELKSLKLKLLSHFREVDTILTPTVPHLASITGSSDMITATANISRFTYLWSIAQTPALSIPCGFSKENLPIGIQIVGPQHGEELLFRIGSAYQTATEWHLRQP